MTKIKNTKKGMAKKTLSMSLVVAMLATSNVPVWAAEFSDGSDVAVATEAPAEFADETEAPVVEDVVTDNTTSATAVSVDAKITENGWGEAATVKVNSITQLAADDTVKCIWKVNGLEVYREEAKKVSELSKLTYTPTKADCGGELQLVLSYTDPTGKDDSKDFTWESNKVTVSKHDINKDNITVTMKAAGPTYDGKNHNDASEWVADYDTLAAKYNVSVITDKDFVNADSNITAKVTPKDTTYYQGEVTSKTTASIAKSTYIDKLKVEYVGSGYTYTGSEIALKASDFKLTDTLSGEVLDSSKYIDLAKSTNVKFKDAGEYEATVVTKDLVNYATAAQNVKAGNKWKIEKADLSKCTVFLGEISEKATPVLASDLTKITISDGTHTLCDGAIPADFVIGNVQANTGSVGTYTATVQTKANSTNFTGTTTTATFRVVRNALSNAEFEGTTSNKKSYAKADENYTGEAITKDTKKLGDLVILQGGKKVKLTAGVDYDPTFEYSNNTNAGNASFTVTGKGSFEGSKLVVPFKIKAAHVTNNNDAVSAKVGFVEDSTRKASDYKSGITVNVKAENDDKKAFTLVEGTDYSVKYEYENPSAGNVITNRIKVTITLLNNNFGSKGTTLTPEYVILSKKQISSVTVTPVQSSYTYTGAAIVPELIVKDGETELSKGEDYVVKSVSNNKNVGTATIVIAGAKNSDYDDDSTAKATFTITPANTSDLVVNVDDQSYDGTKKKPTPANIKLNGVNITDKFIVSYPTSAQANRQVGTGTLTLTPDNGNKNFTGTKEVSFNIVGKKLAFDAANGDKFEVYKADGTKDTNIDFTYDGTAHTYAKAVATIFDGSKKLVEGTDYEIKYFHNVSGTNTGAKGKAYVAVVGKGNYAGDGSYNITDENGKIVNCIVNKEFNINRLQLVKQCVAIKDAEYAEGLPVKPQVTVTYGGNVLTEDTDYTLKLSDTVTTVSSKPPFTATVTGKNGYYDSVTGLSWKVTKKDLANCDVTATKDASGALSVTVMNGSVKVPTAKYVAKENADGTVTVTPAKDSKYYTGSKTVALAGDKTKVGTPVISGVKVVGNKATVILSGEADGASGYDYVISKANDTTTARVDVTKNQVKTTGDFTYVQQGTYYAYCHAWTRNAEGKKVFGEWSNIYPFSVSAITPAQPVITSVKAKGTTVTVTYTKAANAEGYDVVLGSAAKKVNGEYRPVSYGKLVKKNIKGNVVTATFKNVKKGTYYAGLHAFNKTSEDGKKVFSQWSNVKKVTVK